VVEKLRTMFPHKTMELVVDGSVHGTNPKVSNLINMSARIAHDIIVLADADIRVRPDYLSRVVDKLEHVGGVVTAPYYGISTDSVWSRLAQLNLDGHFLPGVRPLRSTAARWWRSAALRPLPIAWLTITRSAP
jgi:ceramide glucosyltransferase